MAPVLQFPGVLLGAPGTARAQPTVADEDARRCALDTRASWIVEAPAGSGKTGLLMQRFLKLLGGDDVTDPGEVLAITFTRKATAELRTRVLEQLEAAHGGTPLRENASSFDRTTRELAAAVLTRDAQLDWHLLEDPGKLLIRTIDSLCAEIANTLPLLSGGGGARRPMEDATPLYRLAARRTLLLLGGSDSDLHEALETVLLHRDGSLADCEALLARMLQNREQWAELVPLDHGSLSEEALETQVRPRLERALENVVCAGLSRAVEALPPGALHALTALAHRLSIEPGYKGADSPISFCANLHLPPEAQADHLDHWVALLNLLLTKDGSWRRSFAVNHMGFSLPKREKAELEALLTSLASEPIRDALCAVRALPSAHYPDYQWRIAKALFRLLLHALAELKVLFAERGECDFAELAIAAREALHSETGPADYASSAGASLRHLLVDEMQDTSSAQYELLDLLTHTWDGHSQTLFLVGDPKQSIYLFRQARVERFLRTMDSCRLGDVPLGALRLTSNFRSQEQLVTGFNDDFIRIFPAPGSGSPAPSDAGDVPFIAASAVREPTDAAGTVWHTDIIEKPDPLQGDNPKAEHTLEEAREIRRIVEHWRSAPLPPGRKEPWRIAVLARARKHLAPIVAEFQRTDASGRTVPFRAVRVEALAERQEVLDVLALTRALLHPADRAAWLAVLHAPWCGLGLADLIALTGDGATVFPEVPHDLTLPTLIATRAAFLSPEGQDLLARCWPWLHTAQREAGRGGFPMLVERTWRCLGGDVTLQPEQLANVERFLVLLRDAEEPGTRLDLASLSIKLAELYAEPAAFEDAVDLMTIHTAKGLEWDVVLVTALEKRGQPSRPELLHWLELDGAGGSGEPSILLAPIQRTGEHASELSRWLRGVENAREKAERKRLLYVACTRAREELHLFAACERTSSGALRVPPGTLLESYWPAAQEHFASFANSAAGPLPLAVAAPAQDDGEEGTLALAAAAETSPAHEPPMVQRLPRGYDPAERFRFAMEHRLPYPAASPFDPQAPHSRPEGSFAVRAFGNVVHRFLQLAADRLQAGRDAGDLLRELTHWQPRLLASFRSEGLPPAASAREAVRALGYLTATLSDSLGRWILSPHAAAGSESTLVFSAEQTSTSRVDRIFFAGAEPLALGEDTLWVIDFKTTEQGARSPEGFTEEERAKYTPQLTRYANLMRVAHNWSGPIMFGLYYPSVPRLLHWQDTSRLTLDDAPHQPSSS